MRIALIHPNFDEQSQLNPEINSKHPTHIETHVVNVKNHLEKGGHEPLLIEATNNLLNDIEDTRPLDLIFNMSIGLSDKRMQANMVGMLEMTKIPILGSGLSTHIVGLHKGLTKGLLQANGIPTPHFQLIKSINDEIEDYFSFPVIVKPEHEGSGIGVTPSSKVDSPAELQAIISEKLDAHGQIIIVEEFLPGREFTVGVMGNEMLEVLPIQETKFAKEGPQILTNQMKADNTVITELPANISDELRTEIETLAKQAFRLLRCEDFVRIDFRLDGEGVPNIIELNTYPGMIEDYSFFPYIAEEAGYSYTALINHLAELAVKPKSFIP